MRIKLFFILFSCQSLLLSAQVFQGIVVDSKTNQPLQGVTVTLTEDNITVSTNSSGAFTLTANDNTPKTLTAELGASENYMFFEAINEIPQSGMNIALRPKVKSAATLRWENYMGANGTGGNCSAYNAPTIPNDIHWNVNFKTTDVFGDLANNANYSRRDPSKIIEVNNTYYVYYTRGEATSSHWFNTNWGGYKPGVTPESDKVFTWDYCDVYYATSTDGYTWTEQGPAVLRGATGAYDDRSVFTPEILAHQGKYYLVYQVVKSPYLERVKNNVGMAVANSPAGPFVKLDQPILTPTNNGKWTAGSTSRLDADKKGDFDSHKVHDPCLVFYKNKFYLYYKGERMGEDRYCGEREIKWGVAIADSPTGPYIKSEYNPITNTGHEVSVWPYQNGIAIIQHLDGPEKGTIQFAEDGLNFEIKGRATGVAEALGIAVSNSNGNHPGTGVTWGLAHKYIWGNGINGGKNYMERFDLDINYNLSTKDLENSKTLIYPNPSKDVINLKGKNFKDLSIYDVHGKKIDVYNNQKSIDISSLPNGLYFIKTDTGLCEKFIKQ
ncbi:family 43 glycosylhydrolase [Tamlana sp. 2_MG-2023]|uniref:T9SS type A sorting domain-containing protein n=1 Tax=unclassified Tamlana TaxID=2614803 RepID=UPI0026E117C1|nr:MULTISPECIES: T9SS type A sorting domain-containing protein [unclassified Tamlana]MDO6761789.1 family 43 glycosylhydrolase [Tamlana sp. 2_MG-2023]MDO6792550.1 family 43 glycosylhydrolase [Tamlana sp. 1_MG-2023]